MYWVIIIAVGLLWLLATIINSISDSIQEAKQNAEYKKKRVEKYGDRKINMSLPLFERNKDIINQFAAKVKTGYQQRYYLENLTRDCVNEICLAEGQMKLSPKSSYLSSWEPLAPTEWRMLSRSILKEFENLKQVKELLEKEAENERKQKEREAREERDRIEQQKEMELRKIKEEIREVRDALDVKNNALIDPRRFQKIKFIDVNKDIININVIKQILKPNDQSWNEREKEILNYRGTFNEFPLYRDPLKLPEAKRLNEAIRQYNDRHREFVELHKQNKQKFKKLVEGYVKGESDSVAERINYVINDLDFPDSIPKVWQVTFDAEEKIAIIEFKLPDVSHAKIVKNVVLKSGVTEKPLNKKEAQETVPNIHPALLLRVAYEVFRSDYADAISLLVINGWVEFDDPATGKKKKTHTSSVAMKKDQIIDMNLLRIDPLTAFSNLKGKSAGKLIEIIPITPIISMNRNDKRFIETKRVLANLDSASNLAAMDWKDFESLIAELFEKIFNKDGVEIKVTQASRDRGVDAVIFDPDPIKGGKFVVQAKRYTNTVDVSAVRDLCAVVKKEGASRGILVTTSSFGADAYEFAKNEPITLLNGSELLGLLQTHGYVFRIDLKEARKLNAANN